VAHFPHFFLFLQGGDVVMTVAQVLEKKTFGLIHADPEMPVKQAMDLMLEKHIHSLVVFENGAMVGIVSDRDYAHKIVAKGINPETLRIGEIMTRNVITIEPSATIEECMKIMSEGRFRHLPVAEGGRIVGMVSMTDVMRVIVAEADTDQEWQM